VKSIASGRIVPGSPIDTDGVSPSELQERIGADRRGEPYLLYRDGAYRQQIFELSEQAPQLTIGRATGCDVSLHWDEGISRAHARLERLGMDAWMLVDDGLSRNGTIVNGERLRQRRRLMDGDVLRFGDTHVVYRAPLRETHRGVTRAAPASEIELSAAQRRVLIALCRPYREGAEFATPASNQEIADDLVLSVEAVKTQLRALFEKFDVEPLARDMKRTRLVQRAFESGVVSQQDLERQ
jgi:pSer/pThr/pTyr-binding forkhead associated (FHA) protein/DNA-binding CsgD family transcriptional regulator